jgi:hypothetical protein
MIPFIIAPFGGQPTLLKAEGVDRQFLALTKVTVDAAMLREKVDQYNYSPKARDEKMAELKTAEDADMQRAFEPLASAAEAVLSQADHWTPEAYRGRAVLEQPATDTLAHAARLAKLSPLHLQQFTAQAIALGKIGAVQQAFEEALSRDESRMPSEVRRAIGAMIEAMPLPGLKEAQDVIRDVRHKYEQAKLIRLRKTDPVSKLAAFRRAEGE